jgi:hypothetical protein
MMNMASLARRDVPPPEDALPPGWGVWQDQAGKSYFYNKDLKVSQWNRPAAAGLGSNVEAISIFGENVPASPAARRNDRNDHIGITGSCSLEPVITEVQPGTSANTAGLLVGDAELIPVVEISQVQKHKTAEICSLQPDLDLQMWLTLDVLSIQTDSNVEYMLNHQEVCDNFLELVLESSTPFLVSVRYAGAFQKYATRKRSEDMRMSDAADEKGAALEQLACAIAREKKFASLLISSSKFRDLKDDASVANMKFYEEVTDALRLATWFKLKAFVSEPVIAALVRNQWNLTRGCKLSPALRFWLYWISYIIFCFLAWLQKPGVTDSSEKSSAWITNGDLDSLVLILFIGHEVSVLLRVLDFLLSSSVMLRRTPWNASSERRKLKEESLERRKDLVKESSQLYNSSGCCTGCSTGAKDLSTIMFHVLVEFASVCLALSALIVRSDETSDAADVYLFFMVLWWGRLVTILQVFRFSGSHNVLV